MRPAHPMRLLLASAAAFVLAAPVLSAQRDSRQDTTFKWEGSVPAGRWVILRNLNGAVRVEGGTGDKVEVTGTKRWRRGNPDEVRITVEHFGDSKESVIICALWTDNAVCDEDGYRSHSDNDGWRGRSNDVSVDFVVKLPKGVKVETSTVNGSVRISGATAEVDASTVNGGVQATSSGGPVHATTVNGDVDVRMSDSGTGDLEYSTVNGSVNIELPGPLDAELDMATVNGSLSSDFPLTVTGKISPRRIRATIGKGGRRIKVHTVNGSVELRKAE